MKTSSIETAGRRLRVRLLPDFVEYAPLRWLVLSGLVLMAAIAIGTTLTISKFRESAIQTGSSVRRLSSFFGVLTLCPPLKFALEHTR